MTTISTKIPDTLFRQAKSIAEREDMTLDEFIALALASQISSWSAGKTFEERAQKGDWKKAREILAKAPDVEAEDYDKL
jgi:predicted nucleic acid-binding protein